MEMRLLKEEIAFEQLAAAAQGQAVVEGSVTLPGGLRETAQVLSCGGSVHVARAEAMQDKMTVSGRVMFHALYTQGDPNKVCALEAGADFTHVMDLPGASPRCTAEADAVVEHVDATCAAGQMNLRAMLRLSGRGILSQPMQVVTGIMDVDGLQARTRELSARRTVAGGTTETLLREEFDLPASLGVRETLLATAVPQIQEVTGGAGRAGVSGVVRLEVYHASGMEGTPLVITHHTIPFEQTVELNGGEGDLLEAEAEVVDVAAASQDAGEDARVLRVETQLGLRVRADRRDTFTVLDDAYTTSGDTLLLNQETAVFRVDDTDAQTAESGKAMLMLPDGTPPIRQVLCAFVSPVMTDHHQAGSRLVTEGMLEITLLCTAREGDTPVAVNMEEPFRMTFSAEACGADFLTLTVSDVDASAITADRVQLRYIMHLQCSGAQSASADLVTDVMTGQPDPVTGSIVLYFAQPGDTIWDIAKRYRVSEDDLRRLNPDMSADLRPGQGVVIWRKSGDQDENGEGEMAEKR